MNAYVNAEVSLLVKKLDSCLSKIETRKSDINGTNLYLGTVKAEGNTGSEARRAVSTMTLYSIEIWNSLKLFHAEISNEGPLKYINKMYAHLLKASLVVTFAPLYIAGQRDHDCSESDKSQLLKVIVMFTASEMIEIIRKGSVKGWRLSEVKIQLIEDYLQRLKRDDEADSRFHTVLYAEIMRQIDEGKYPWQTEKRFEDLDGIWKDGLTKAFRKVYGTLDPPAQAGLSFNAISTIRDIVPGT
jgi:hypothetical protein